LNNKYDNLYKASIADPEKFWGEAAKDVKWFSPYKKVLDISNPPFYRWFVEGKINTCFNAVDRHVERETDLGQLLFMIALLLLKKFHLVILR